ncbi:TPA: hypothetical protein EYP66_05885 [Candidatus Poribacteria bacterium]|nr:hypothetical protein [Candidatus Poribacteria bacterium]
MKALLGNLISRRVFEIVEIVNLSRYITNPYFPTEHDDFDASISGWFRDSITFADGSNLFIREEYQLIDWKLAIRYGYVYLDANGNEVLRFDNSPFHPEIWSFPHHKHSKETPDAKPFSGELRDVIAEIDALVETNLSEEQY